MQGFGLHAGVAILGVAVVGRTLPDAGGHHLRPGLQVAGMHRCLPVRVERATGDMRQLFGHERRTRGGDAGFADVALGRPGHQPRGRQRRVATLGRAHAHGGVALDQLHVAIADAGGVDDIGHLQVFVEVDEVLALGVGEDRPIEVDPGFAVEGNALGAHCQAQGEGGLGAGIHAIGDDVVQPVTRIDRACDIQVLWQAADGELRTLVVVGQFAAGLAQQLIDRHVTGRHAQ
ncbi:hypothetical protein D3C84_727220 [compost metagenome]